MSSQRCYRCELLFDETLLINSGGCKLCKTCFQIIETEYPKYLADEFNHFEEKCRGCE